MENATKALIIAGAVLISILLIGIGMMVFNAANDPINQAQKSSEAQAIQMFNDQFTPYLGSGVSAQQAKSIISAVNASNGKDADHHVTLDTAGITKVSGVVSGRKYNIEEFDDDNNGYIDRIKIEAASKSTGE